MHHGFIDSMARGYHQYKDVWENPVYGKELNCARDIGNSQDSMAVTILKEIDGASVTVGHLPSYTMFGSLTSYFKLLSWHEH